MMLAMAIPIVMITMPLADREISAATGRHDLLGIETCYLVQISACSD
jgi:hypothetical protein